MESQFHKFRLIVTFLEISAWSPIQNGNLQLLQLVISSEENSELQHMQWDGQQWRREPSLKLNVESPNTIKSLAAVLSPSGNLEVIMDNRTGKPGEQTAN